MSEKIMLIYVSSNGNGIGGNNGNNNKFYSVELLDNGDVVKRWGRIGTDGQSGVKKNGGRSEFDKIIREKKKKGYKEASIDTESAEESFDYNLLDVAMDEIHAPDRHAKKLIKELVEKNIHNITSATKIKYDIKTGFFSTPLGVVTKEGVNKAIELLNKLSDLIDADKLKTPVQQRKVIEINEAYFTIIPTIIKDVRDFKNLLITSKRLSEQYAICDALLSSIDIINAEKDKAKKSSKGIKKDKTFDLELSFLDDINEVRRVKKMFEKSKNANHGSRTNNAKISKIYKIKIGKEDKEYRTDLSNHMELWHGTKVANLMSILKSGLLMPKYSPGSVTGYMFGQGLYFSNQSSKSLNYCDGMFWNNAQAQNKIYLFLADIAMGNFQVPRGSTSKKPSKGYDSYWAKPGQSGIMNDEMIVFENNQIRLKYLLEITL